MTVKSKSLQPVLGSFFLATIVPLSAMLGGCGRPDDVAAAEQQAVYVCIETHEAFLGPPQPVPIEHPDTGRPTLMRGLYNPAAKRWQPAPPLELLHGNLGAALRPEQNIPLAPNGPKHGLRSLPAEDN